MATNNLNLIIDLPTKRKQHMATAIVLMLNKRRTSDKKNTFFLYSRVRLFYRKKIFLRDSTQKNLNKIKSCMYIFIVTAQ